MVNGPVPQAMPLNGYTRMFEKMLDHPNIKIMLNCDYREIEKDIPMKRAEAMVQSHAGNGNGKGYVRTDRIVIPDRVITAVNQ